MISIIIPVYKAEKTLEDTVRSALAQQTETEIILIDDGSPDGCPALCDELAAAYGNIRVIHQKNGGICRARNAGGLQIKSDTDVPPFPRRYVFVGREVRLYAIVILK